MSARDQSHRRRHSTRHSSRRRREKQKAHHLTQDDIDFLKKNTRYDESEIREWYKGFKVKKEEQHECVTDDKRTTSSSYCLGQLFP